MKRFAFVKRRVRPDGKVTTERIELPAEIDDVLFEVKKWKEVMPGDDAEEVMNLAEAWNDLVPLLEEYEVPGDV